MLWFGLKIYLTNTCKLSVFQSLLDIYTHIRTKAVDNGQKNKDKLTYKIIV